jgi:hypothetical protein
MKDRTVLNFLESNVGALIVVVIPAFLFYATFDYGNFLDKISNMQHEEIFRIVLSILIMLISYLFLLVIKLRLKQLAIIDYANLLREDASEINNYLSHCAENRIMQIQTELQNRGLVSNWLPDVITNEEKRLHDELGKKREKNRIELYELITGKKYEPNRD